MLSDIDKQGVTIWYQSIDLAPRTHPASEIMAELDLKDQLAALVMTMRETNSKIDSLSGEVATVKSTVASLDEIKPALVDLALWKPKVDHAVEALQADLGNLRLAINNLTTTAPSSTAPSTAYLPLPTLEKRPDLRVEANRALPGDEGRHGPSGHRVDYTHRGSVMGSLPHTTPAKGTFSSHSNELSFSSPRERGGKTPRMDCPGFDGETPLEWKLKCESYFRVCRIDKEIWVDTAVVYFTGEAALWLQWTNAHLAAATWEEFVSSVCEKFSRREFEQLLRQFSRLRQTGTVAEYAAQFTVAMNNLIAHHSSWDPLYFVTKFVDGLRSDIRVVVMVQQPRNLESVVALAGLQEEAMELTKEVARVEGGRTPFSRVPRTAMPLPPPPPVGRPPGPVPGVRTDDRRGAASAQVPSTDDKVQAMRAYRRARGLCYTCGEKWGRDHVCGPTVQLHVVEELLELLVCERETNSSQGDRPMLAHLCVISDAAQHGVEPPLSG